MKMKLIAILEDLNVYEYLAERSHIILSGHVHGTIVRPHRIHNRAYLFTAGATYADKSYKNNFSILKINKSDRTLRRKSFEYIPYDASWQEILDPEVYDLRSKAFIDKPSTEFSEKGYDYEKLIKKSKEYVLKFIENKSKAIARTSKLPESNRKENFMA